MRVMEKVARRAPPALEARDDGDGELSPGRDMRREARARRTTHEAWPGSKHAWEHCLG